jgi:lipoprotein-releasing system permease protein
MILIFAWRYLKGKKSTQAVQIISWVSVAAMAVGTAALIIVLSVFNGFEGFIKELYSDFYPEIKISASVGKNFQFSAENKFKLNSIKSIQSVSYSLEEKILMAHDETQMIGIIKGVDEQYDEVTNFTKHIKYGKAYFKDVANEFPKIVLGLGVSNKLSVNEQSALPMNCYAFKKNAAFNSLNPDAVYSSSLYQVSGVYLLQDVIDNQYGFASLESVQNLTDKPNELSSIELKLKNNANADDVKASLQQLFKSQPFKIETRLEQNRTLYFVLKSERWAVYAILTLMLIIASFNIIGSLSMLVIEKEKDIAILKTMGMQNNIIQKIFLSTGVLLSMLGAVIGCILALVICLLQQHFGFVKLGSGDSFLINAYPVKLHVFDFVLVLATVVFIAALASLIPSIKASKKEITLRVK